MYRFVVANPSKSGRLPIRAVVARTGLGPDTIRAWERRYQAVSPVRTEGGTRQFSEEDVTRLLCLKELRDRGFSMPTIAGLSTRELTSMRGRGSRGGFARVQAASQPPLSSAHKEYLDKVQNLDASGARALLREMAEGVDSLELILSLAIPIMWEVGRRWNEGSLGTAPEHLVRAQLRQIMTSRFEQIPESPGARRLLFTTPAGQLNEFGILAGSVLAKEAGFDVLYLGPDLPIEDIIWSVAKSKADVLVLSVVRHMDEDQIRQMERLVDTVAPNVPVWIGCPPEHPLTGRTPKATFISSIEDFQLAASSLLESESQA